MSTKGQKTKRRTEHLNTIQYKYYIYTEGTKTEPNYFNGFKRNLSPVYKNLVQISIVPKGEGTIKILDAAHRQVRSQNIESGMIWCVYDKDDFPDQDFNSVPQKMAQYNKKKSTLQYYPAWSNECFEIWFVWHFSEYVSDNGRDAYYDFLDKKMSEIGVKEYKKNLEHIFDILYKNGNPKLAIQRAKNSLKDTKEIQPSQIIPGSTVYQLVEELAQYLPEDIKIKFI